MQIPDPALVLLVGASGSGKSTWAAARYRDVEVVSSDALRAVVTCHRDETGSPVAAALLAGWPAAVRRFSAIVPRDYKRVLEATRRAEAAGRPVDEAIMEAARN